MNKLVTHIAITNPFRWPYVRRGSERVLNDLTNYLVSKQYHVETYTLGPSLKDWEELFVSHHTLPLRFKTHKRQFNECHYFAHALIRKLRYSSAQVIHCLNYFDAYAAIRARNKYKLNFKIVFHVVGIPTAKYFRAVPLDAYYFRTTIKSADAIWTLSKFAQQQILTDFGQVSEVMPPPVAIKTVDLAIKISRKSSPTILFVGDCNEPRKGMQVLLQALLIVKATLPNVKLQLSGNIAMTTITALNNDPNLQSIMHDVEFLGVGDVADLPSLYAGADITVLPSVWEAFGLVVVESLAQGTPVVGCNHAGIIDIINSPTVGELFEAGNFTLATQNSSGLAVAIINLLERVQKSDLRHDCIKRALEYSWDVLGPIYEKRYKELVCD